MARLHFEREPFANNSNALILLAEDLDDDVLLIRRAFREANFLNPLQVVCNGRETIAYLAGTGRYASRDEYPLPSLLLLDLDMPYQDGFEVLKWIRQRPQLRGVAGGGLERFRAGGGHNAGI